MSPATEALNTTSREHTIPGDVVTASVNNKIGAVLVVGAGISGMQAALDLADSGYYVYLLEQKPAIGGLMAKLDKTFPTNDCAMCVMSPKLVDCGRHLNIEIITYADIEAISGSPGNYTVTIKRKARSVDEEKCTGCGECVAACPVRYKVLPPVKDNSLYQPQLTETEKTFVKELVDNEPDVAGNLLSVLHTINHTYRYLPKPILQYLADITHIPLARFISVGTFYNAFSLTPRGEYTIAVCMGTACHVKGSGRLLDRLGEILQIPEGGTTNDGKFTLEAVRCIGCCALAPAIRIGEETFGKVKRANLEHILSEF